MSDVFEQRLVMDSNSKATFRRNEWPILKPRWIHHVPTENCQFSSARGNLFSQLHSLLVHTRSASQLSKSFLFVARAMSQWNTENNQSCTLHIAKEKVQSHSMHIPFGKIASFRHWNCPYVNLSPFGCRAFVRMFHLRRRQGNNHFYDFMPHISAHTHEFLSSFANAFGELADASRNTIIEVEIYFMFCSATWVCRTTTCATFFIISLPQFSLCIRWPMKLFLRQLRQQSKNV